MPIRKPADPSKPYMPAPYTKYDIYAIKALQDGTANSAQQQRALAWIINHACKTYDQPYHPGVDGDRDTILACGKMLVGQQIVKLVNYDATLLNKME